MKLDDKQQHNKIFTHNIFIVYISIVLFALMNFYGCSGKKSDINYELKPKPTVVVNEILPTEKNNKSNEQETDNGNYSNYNSNESIVSNSRNTTETTSGDILYNINIDIDPAKRFVNVIEKVKFKNNTKWDINNIYMNVPLNAFSINEKELPFFEEHKEKVYKYGIDYSEFNIISIFVNNEAVDYSIDGINLTIKLNEPLLIGSSIDTTIQFEAKIPQIAHRTGANDNAIWFGNFLPMIVAYNEMNPEMYPYYRAGKPFFYDISKFTVSITTPLKYKVYGTGMEIESEKDDKRITSFETKIVRDFAFIVSDKFIVDPIETKDGTIINFCHYSVEDIDADKILSIVEQSIDYYNNAIGSYPYNAIDIVETELFISGIEAYPGIIFVDQDLLNKAGVYYDLAHAVGHQWFYNFIGNNPILEPWLDEGIITFLSKHIFYGKEEIRNQMENLYDIMESNLNKISPNIINSNASSFNNWSDYINICSSKASLMFYSLKLKMGNDNFNVFLKEYFNRYSFKTVDANALIRTASDVYGEDLTEFFNDWLNNSEMPSL